jgi:hypothetical protein
LVDVVLDAGKGNDEEVEDVDSLYVIETLRDPLQRAMENQANDQQDEEQ